MVATSMVFDDNVTQSVLWVPTSNITPPLTSTIYSQHLSSVGVQFVLTCIIGGSGSLYTLRSLKKVSSSQKVLRKYIAIPNLLVAGLLVCGLIIPLRMFAAIMLLAGDKIHAFCLAIFYVEHLCEITANVSMIILAVQRLRGSFRKVFSGTDITRAFTKSAHVAVILSWLLPLAIMSLFTYLCASKAAALPRILSTCSHHFLLGGTPATPPVAVAVDLTFPLLSAATFLVLLVAYTGIVLQMYSKTKLVHPSFTTTDLVAARTDRNNSSQRSTLGSKGKTVSWSSIKTAGPRFSEITSQRHSNCTNDLDLNPSHSVYGVADDFSDVHNSSQTRDSTETTFTQVSDSYSLQEAIRKTSFLSLIQVSTIPEMRSEEDMCESEDRSLRKSVNSEQSTRSSADSLTRGSTLSYPLRRRHLPPVKFPHNRGSNALSNRTLKKKKKKWSRSTRKRNVLVRNLSQTSQDSNVSQSSSVVSMEMLNATLGQRGITPCPPRATLKRQDAMLGSQADMFDDQDLAVTKLSESGMFDKQDNSSGSLSRHHSPEQNIPGAVSDTERAEKETARKSKSLPCAHNSNLSSFESTELQQSDDPDDTKRWHSANSQCYPISPVNYVPLNNAHNASSRRNRPNSWHAKTQQCGPAIDDNPADAPQIRIIRPSTDTITIAGPCKPVLGAMGHRQNSTWTPMRTITSTSDSEYDIFAATDSARGSPTSQESRLGSSQSNYSSVSRWGYRSSLYHQPPHRDQSAALSRQFSLASIWSNIPRLRPDAPKTSSSSSSGDVSAVFVLRRSLLIVGTFLLTHLPIAITQAFMYQIHPAVLVNIYPLLKLCQHVNFALGPYIYVFSNQKIHRELKTENSL